MNRVFAVAVSACWLVAMAALVHRDVLPMWSAMAPPRQALPTEGRQIGIVGADGRRVGTTWITATPAGHPTSLHSATILAFPRIAALLPGVSRLLVETDLTYTEGGSLDQFQFSVRGAHLPIRVSGERYGRDFACTATIGTLCTTIPFDGRLSEYLGESMRPFTQLRGLYVGQSWRLRLVDPLTLLKGGPLEFQTKLATVTRREGLEHDGRWVECFRIEAPGATAWAADDGRVLRQEVQVPLLGRWTLIDESFDRRAMKRALAGFKAGGPGRKAG